MFYFANDIFDYFKTQGKLRNLDKKCIYLLVVIYLWPNLFLGTVDSRWFYSSFSDYSLIGFLISLPLLFFRGEKDHIKIPGRACLSILCCYIFFIFLRSIYLEVPFREIISCLRINLIWPLSAFCILRGLESLTLPQLTAMIRLILILFIIQSLLAGFSAITGINIFVVDRCNDEDEYLQSFSGVIGNTRVYPKQSVVLGALILALMVIKCNKTWILLGILCLALPMVYTYRAASVEMIVIFAVIIALTSFFVIGKSIKIALIMMFVAILSLLLVMQNPFLKEKINAKFFQNMSISQVDYSNYDSYMFRLSLFEYSISHLDSGVTAICGNGYQRDDDLLDRYEAYSYVLGGDAPLAAIIFCEGWGGLILRIMVYLALLRFAFGHIVPKESWGNRLLSIIVIAVFIGSSVNFLQSQILTQFDYYYAMLGMLYLWVTKFNDYCCGVAKIEQDAPQKYPSASNQEYQKEQVCPATIM